MVAACLLAGAVAVSLLGTEAALFTVVSYAGLRLSLAVLTTLSGRSLPSGDREAAVTS
jgi:hypothetical protein